mgnify:CR=1 FL=1
MFFAPVIRNRAFSSSLRSFDRDFERFVNEVFYRPAAASAASRPAARRCEVKQGDEAITLSLDLPGIAREDLSIGVEGEVLRIETRAEASRQAQYAWEIPQDVDVSATSAKLENGVLTLTLPRTRPERRVTQIPLN